MEPIDQKVLRHPDKYLLEAGGHILMALMNEAPVGTVALKKAGAHTYEFTKMAVDENLRGKKIGEQLAQAAIAWCRANNAREIILYSNTKLVPALQLYRKLGFEEVPLDGPYTRSDIKMKRLLNKTDVNQLGQYLCGPAHEKS
jgi:GNAT superfamily N-acetyltransferase